MLKNWLYKLTQSFSIDQNESVIFNQLDNSSSVLNWVLSQDVSIILGTLQSNGSLLLINPNRVLIDTGDVPFIGPLVLTVRSTAARIYNSLIGNGFSVVTVQNGDLNMLGNRQVVGGQAQISICGPLDVFVNNGNLNMNKLNKQDTSKFRFNFSLMASY